LLRRFRKDGSLPSIHPLVDVCNAVSLVYAIPLAMADRRGHQVLIGSTSVRTSLGASGCDKSKHQRAETKHGNQDANDQIVAAVPHRMQDHHGHENTNSDKDGASAMRRTADPSDCRH
jgi:DNA/RNA-binding domain of Phe-tRNA-synthetase-like protein